MSPAVRRRGRLAGTAGDGLSVLVVSASMGGGHDGAAREIAGRLQAMGYRAEVRDLLQAAPVRIGPTFRAAYEFQLRHAPSTYEATYRLWFRVPWLCPWVARLATVLTRRTLCRWVVESSADAVVSTYPLATLAIGSMRSAGRLPVPLVNFVTDFAVHPLWVHPGADLTLTVDDSAARTASGRIHRNVVPCGPAVSARFEPGNLPERRRARDRIGLRPDDAAVLIVAGSWGVGGVLDTVAVVAGHGFVPVVVCGRDARLRRQVERQAAQMDTRMVVVGWTQDMPALMSACDALVENAGGLTALEAMKAGLPVVSFDPIPGHGRENAAAMSQAGVSVWATDGKDLASWLEALTRPGPARSRQTSIAAGIFREDPATLIAATVGEGAGGPRRMREAEPA